MSIFDNPFIYNLSQNLLGKDKLYKHIKDIIVKVNPSLVIELGCGTGAMLKYLDKNISYIGIDNNKNYFKYIKKKDLNHITFLFIHERDITTDFDSLFSKYDDKKCILINGVLHHLDNNQDIKVINNCKKIMKKGDLLLIIEPISDQKNIIGKILTKLDRGKFIRSSNDSINMFILQGIFCNMFSTKENKFEIHSIVESNLYRIPYDVMKISIIKR